ncbi:hypothetical protein Tco_0992683 [Tanacetum coccineum]|uniref:Retrotransposon protein, putative, unclassified n=1 Tax=Tanacetum coccineum TaxID=301880 RepID=A0ABQ5F3A6_9ASTR
MKYCDPVDTPMVEKSKLDEDTQGKVIDLNLCRIVMVDTLLYYSLASYADVDHACCHDTRRSTSGSMQLLRERLVSCLPTMALGSIKFQCTVITKALLPYAATMFNINSRSKHIDIRFHFIKEQVENGVVELYFVNMEYQLADIFTKALGIERIEFLINKLGMRSFTLETLKQLADEAEE